MDHGGAASLNSSTASTASSGGGTNRNVFTLMRKNVAKLKDRRSANKHAQHATATSSPTKVKKKQRVSEQGDESSARSEQGDAKMAYDDDGARRRRRELDAALRRRMRGDERRRRETVRFEATLETLVGDLQRLKLQAPGGAADDGIGHIAALCDLSRTCLVAATTLMEKEERHLAAKAKQNARTSARLPTTDIERIEAPKRRAPARRSRVSTMPAAGTAPTPASLSVAKRPRRPTDAAFDVIGWLSRNDLAATAGTFVELGLDDIDTLAEQSADEISTKTPLTLEQATALLRSMDQAAAAEQVDAAVEADAAKSDAPSREIVADVAADTDTSTATAAATGNLTASVAPAIVVDQSSEVVRTEPVRGEALDCDGCGLRLRADEMDASAPFCAECDWSRRGERALESDDAQLRLYRALVGRLTVALRHQCVLINAAASGNNSGGVADDDERGNRVPTDPLVRRWDGERRARQLQAQVRAARGRGLDDDSSDDENENDDGGITYVFSSMDTSGAADVVDASSPAGGAMHYAVPFPVATDIYVGDRARANELLDALERAAASLDEGGADAELDVGEAASADIHLIEHLSSMFADADHPYGQALSHWVARTANEVADAQQRAQRAHTQVLAGVEAGNDDGATAEGDGAQLELEDRANAAARDVWTRVLDDVGGRLKTFVHEARRTLLLNFAEYAPVERYLVNALDRVVFDHAYPHLASIYMRRDALLIDGFTAQLKRVRHIHPALLEIDRVFWALLVDPTDEWEVPTLRSNESDEAAPDVDASAFDEAFAALALPNGSSSVDEKDLILPASRDALRQMSAATTVEEKLRCLVRVGDIIAEKVHKSFGDDVILGADELLPIYCYVIGRSHDASRLLPTEVSFCDDFMPKRLANGKLGYYLVTLQMVLGYMTELNIDESARDCRLRVVRALRSADDGDAAEELPDTGVKSADVVGAKDGASASGEAGGGNAAHVGDSAKADSNKSAPAAASDSYRNTPAQSKSSKELPPYFGDSYRERGRVERWVGMQQQVDLLEALGGLCDEGEEVVFGHAATMRVNEARGSHAVSSGTLCLTTHRVAFIGKDKYARRSVQAQDYTQTHKGKHGVVLFKVALNRVRDFTATRVDERSRTCIISVKHGDKSGDTTKEASFTIVGRTASAVARDTAQIMMRTPAHKLSVFNEYEAKFMTSAGATSGDGDGDGGDGDAKLVPRAVLLRVDDDLVRVRDARSGDYIEEHPLAHLKRWGHKKKQVGLDFSPHDDEYKKFVVDDADDLVLYLHFATNRAARRRGYEVRSWLAEHVSFGVVGGVGGGARTSKPLSGTASSAAPDSAKSSPPVSMREEARPKVAPGADDASRVLRRRFDSKGEADGRGGGDEERDGDGAATHDDDGAATANAAESSESKERRWQLNHAITQNRQTIDTLLLPTLTGVLKRENAKRSGKKGSNDDADRQLSDLKEAVRELRGVARHLPLYESASTRDVGTSAPAVAAARNSAAPHVSDRDAPVVTSDAEERRDADRSATEAKNEEAAVYLRELDEKSYYRPDLDRGGAERELNGLPPGSFVVRPSSRGEGALAVTHVDRSHGIGHLLVHTWDTPYLKGFSRGAADMNAFPSIESLMVSMRFPDSCQCGWGGTRARRRSKDVGAEVMASESTRSTSDEAAAAHYGNIDEVRAGLVPPARPPKSGGSRGVRSRLSATLVPVTETSVADQVRSDEELARALADEEARAVARAAERARDGERQRASERQYRLGLLPILLQEADLLQQCQRLLRALGYDDDERMDALQVVFQCVMKVMMTLNYAFPETAHLDVDVTHAEADALSNMQQLMVSKMDETHKVLYA